MIACTRPRHVFIISLPRSGSTMLQRLLGSHVHVTSIPEPGILLPLVYMLRSKGVRAEYGHELINHGITNLLSSMEGGTAEFHSAIRNFVGSLYGKVATRETRYVLDKTPRYYLIAEELGKIFPEAKLIFLFRNPLDVLTSYISAMWGNRLQTCLRATPDLKIGPALVAQSCDALRERALIVRYEELVADPRKHLRLMMDYLDLDSDNSTVDTLLREFSTQQVPFSLGDAAGCRTYKDIDSQDGKWKRALTTDVRKRLARAYVQGIDGRFLQCGGFSRATLLEEIAAVKPGHVGFRDAYCLAKSVLIQQFKRTIGWPHLS
ncbi:MAG: sulfotransferase [Candidatus Nealsonbacteria bacterium]|nr:sulfotransferase [Candidatus Nealsonbacteria bacterium]